MICERSSSSWSALVASYWKLIVFDWDGTLMDSTGAIVRAAERAIRDVGLPMPPSRRIREIIGLGLQESWECLFPGRGLEGYGDFVERYREHFLETERHTIRPYPGVDILVENLLRRGAHLAVATGKSRRGLDRDLEETGLGRFIEHSVTSDEAQSKPHPEMLLRIIAHFGVEPGRTLMVGDTDFDLHMAHGAGAGALAVAWGAHDRRRLQASAPLACLDAATDLPEWLEQFEADLDQGL
jgi:phosphoglycolate phosphatase